MLFPVCAMSVFLGALAPVTPHVSCSVGLDGHVGRGLFMLQKSYWAASRTSSPGSRPLPSSEGHGLPSASKRVQGETAVARSMRHKAGEEATQSVSLLSGVAEQPPELWHSHHTFHFFTQNQMSQCATPTWAISVASLMLVSAGIASRLYLQIQQNRCLQAKLQALRMKLYVDRQAHLSVAQFPAVKRSFRADVEALSESQKALVKAVHDRGNVKLDPELREIVLKRSLKFEPIESSALIDVQLTDAASAKIALSDVAELLRCLSRTRVLIECHTEGFGSLQAVDERAHEEAEACAVLVSSFLVSLGVDVDRLHAIGLPGPLGRNKAQVLFKIMD